MDKHIKNKSSKFRYKSIFRENLEQPYFQIFSCIGIMKNNLPLEYASYF